MSINQIFSVVVVAALSSVLVGLQQYLLWRPYKPKIKRHIFQTFILGLYEQIIYIFIFLRVFNERISVDSINFVVLTIGGYLTIKTLSGVWKEKLKNLGDGVEKGEVFNLYLIGNLSGIIFALAFSYILTFLFLGVFLKIS